MSEPSWLLDGMRNGDVFFASPAQQFRSTGLDGAVCAFTTATAAAVQQLFERARAQGIADPLLFGLVPFDSARPGSFTIPRSVQQSACADRTGLAAIAARKERPAVVGREPVPAPEVYGDMVRAALKLYAEGGVSKIVLSRAPWI